MYAGKNVLVTGGTGMIGVPLVEKLIALGSRVKVASLDDASRVPQGAEFHRGNLMDFDFCRKICAGMDYVFHVAGIKGSVGIGRSKAASFFVPHLLMNTNMMEAAHKAGVERYLFTSSIAVYEPVELFVEDRAWDGPPHSSDRYGAWAKRMGELQAEAYREEFGWEKIAIVRPANVYGPFDNFDPRTGMVVPSLIGRIVKGENPLVVWGDGSAIRDFIFSEDCADGLLLALERGANCTPVNLGSGRRATIRDVVEAVCAAFSKPPGVEFDVSKPAGQPIRLMDMTRARDMLGFEPRTSLQEGIAKTVHWYLKNPGLAENRYNVFQQKNFMDIKS